MNKVKENVGKSAMMPELYCTWVNTAEPCIQLPSAQSDRSNACLTGTPMRKRVVDHIGLIGPMLPSCAPVDGWVDQGLVADFPCRATL